MQLYIIIYHSILHRMCKLETTFNKAYRNNLSLKSYVLSYQFLLYDGLSIDLNYVEAMQTQAQRNDCS